jgi:hypothetical protein
MRCSSSTPSVRGDEDARRCPNRVRAQIGRFNPGGPTAAPTHRLTARSSGAGWTYGGNVEGGTGVELLTPNALELVGVERLQP